MLKEVWIVSSYAHKLLCLARRHWCRCNAIGLGRRLGRCTSSHRAKPQLSNKIQLLPRKKPVVPEGKCSGMHVSNIYREGEILWVYNTDESSTAEVRLGWKGSASLGKSTYNITPWHREMWSDITALLQTEVFFARGADIQERVATLLFF